ncbi:hemicentin-1-like isoform X1 [Lithobates pipiens]
MVKGKMDHIGVGLVCALLLLIQYGNGAQVNITSPDSTPKVLTGDPINLTISYNSTPNLIIWTYNGNLVAVWIDGEQSISAIYKNRLTLQEKQISISGSTPADSGVYMVTVTDASSNTGDFTFSVQVADRVPKIQSNDTGVFKTGENISLTIWYAWEPLSIVWNYNGSPVIVSVNGRIFINDRFKGRANITDNGSLLVYNTTNQDAGIYAVTVASNLTSASRPFEVKFYDVISSVTVQQTPAIVIEGTPMVNLSCKASSGSGSVTWQKDGQPLTNDSSHVLLDQTLQILTPNRTFSGTYRCNMSNPVSWNDGSIEMTVYYPVGEVTVTQSPEIASEMTSLVNLSCSATSGFSETVTWMKDGQSIINDDKYHLLNGNRSLQIIQPNRTFSGNYSCKMSNAAYWNLGSLDLLVYDPVENVIVTQSPKILDGNSTAVNLSCSASSKYIEAVIWTKDGKSIEENDIFTLLDGNHTLQIIDSNRTFSGHYTCNISNAAYRNTGSLQLRIYGPVENVIVTQSPNILDGNSTAVNLSCSASSKYIEAVIWTKDGKSIEENGTFTLLDGNHTLQIIDSNRTFSGHYTCNISNAAYRNTSSLQLLIYDPVENVTVTQSSIIVSEKSPAVNLSCGASSGNIETVMWTKDEKPINITNNYNLLNENKTWILQINKPNRTFSGLYVCNMSNKAYWKSGSHQLRVYDPVLNTKVTQWPDTVTDKTPLVNLSCGASSGLIETVTWTKDGKTLSSDKSYSLKDGNKVLQITKPDKTFSGTYTCNISNAAYEGFGFVKLTVSGATLRAASTFGMMVITLLGGLLLAH